MTAQQFSTYVRRQRRSYGLSQGELALLVGLGSRAQISAIEHGERLPSARVLVALLFVFGMTTAQLFPQLALKTQSSVMSSVKRLLANLESDSTLRAQRKIILLRQIPSRAVMS